MGCFRRWCLLGAPSHYLKRLRAVLPQAASLRTHICFRDHESYAHALYATKILSEADRLEFLPTSSALCADLRLSPPGRDAGRSAGTGAYRELRPHARRPGEQVLRLAGRADPGRQAPRLRPTPSFDLIHWLARSVQSSLDPRERSRRADFCRDYRPGPQAPELRVPSLWTSSEQRDEFLRHCHAPPLEDWPLPAAPEHTVEADAVERRADQIEAEYGRWRERNGGNRKHWAHFWRT